MFGADANQEDSDVFFDRCLKVVRHVYTSLQLHGKYASLLFQSFLLQNFDIETFDRFFIFWFCEVGKDRRRMAWDDSRLLK